MELTKKTDGRTLANKLRYKKREEENPMDLSLTKEHMYFLGFLWADGYILKSKQRIGMEIVTEDYEQIKNLIPKEFKTYKRMRKNKTREITQLYLGRSDYKDFLKNHGYSDKIKPSDFILKSGFLRYWLQGIFDGDGCFYQNQNLKINQISISSKINQDWTYLEDILKELGCEFKVKRITTKTGKYSQLRMCNKKSLELLINFLYPNGYEIGLKRKFNKAMLILNSCKKGSRRI